MANTRSAEKQQRQAEKARTRNRAGKSRLRSQIKNARQAIESGENLPAVMSETFSVIDKAAKARLIKDNTADRYKSRLTAASKKTADANK
jgi:small subunit ribosomal protein S20